MRKMLKEMMMTSKMLEGGKMRMLEGMIMLTLKWIMMRKMLKGIGMIR